MDPGFVENYGITAGPSREELILALQLFHEGRTVEFSVARLQPFVITKVFLLITQLGVESDGGNRWLFKGWSREEVRGYNDFEGYIDTKDRKGWIKPIR